MLTNFGRIKFSSSLFASHMSVSTNQLYQTNQIVLVCHIINILLTELSRSVWENLDRGRVYRPHCVRSVLTTPVKILPYGHPARLIRAKYELINSNMIILAVKVPVIRPSSYYGHFSCFLVIPTPPVHGFYFLVKFTTVS